MKIGSDEWTNKRLYIRWQAVRRDDEYRAFCDKYNQYFDTNEMFDTWLLPTEEVYEAVEEIQSKYELDILYHYKVDHDIDYFIDNCVFKNPFAIDFLLKDKDSEDFNPFWDKKHIVLDVNLDESIPEAQLIDEFREYIQAARESVGIKVIRSAPNEVDFQVYDLLQSKKSRKEIIKEVWPAEYKIEFGKDEPCNEYEQGKLYKKLSEEYQKKGIRDWDGRAYAEAYTRDACEAEHGSGRGRLYTKVSDAVERVEKYIKRIKI